MAYTVLARKYRSETFDEIIGQDPVVQTLRNGIKTGRSAHAFLFAGTRGVGKTTMARVLAKSLNCLAFDAPTTQPCCKCDSCLAVHAGEDIDVIEIDGATNNGVEQVRQLRENAIYRPARARFKTYIIDEVHMLSVGAFNALLKILEEPPSHVKFIFATTEPNKVIPTIQSRCQRFDFKNISYSKIAEQLKAIIKQENIKCEEDLILCLAKMANGSMRDALSLLDRLISTGAETLTVELFEEFLGCASGEKIYDLLAAIGAGNAADTLTTLEDLISTGLGEVQIVDSLIDYMRDLMVVKSAGIGSELLILTAEQRKRIEQLADKFDIAGVIYNISVLEKMRWSIKNSDSPRALLEASLLRFALSEHFLNVGELLQQLRGGSSETVKKNRIIEPDTAGQTSPRAGKEPQAAQLNDIQSVKDDWGNILKVIASKMGNGTAGLLKTAVPSGFENGLLTVAFPESFRMSKKICESNSQIETMQSILSGYAGRDIRLKFEIIADNQGETKASSKQDKTGSQKKNEIINNPAVKAVLTELDATITGIEEDRQD